MIYAGAVFQPLVTVCCNVLLQGVVSWEGSGLCFTLLHHHRHCIHTNTNTQEYTHYVFMSSADIELLSLALHTKPYYAFSFFLMCEGVAAVHYNDETLDSLPGV